MAAFWSSEPCSAGFSLDVMHGLKKLFAATADTPVFDHARPEENLAPLGN